MVEVEAFSSVHDMIQAALDKHGRTATLREVRLVEEEGERDGMLFSELQWRPEEEEVDFFFFFLRSLACPLLF